MPIVAARSSAAATKQKRRKKQLQFLVLGAAGAGKTSLLRRFFHGQFTYRRAPTVGADFYVGKVPRTSCCAKDDVTDNTTTTTGADNGLTTMTNPPVGGRRKARLSETSDKNDNEDDDVLVQIWDTPGKENFAMRPRQVQTAVTMQDSFFDHADAIMLVYDMTSSTSFTRLLRWYADLIELFQRQQQAMTNDNNNATTTTTTTTGGKNNNKRPKPILLVANKLDLFEQATNPRHKQSKTRVSQRDVLGLRGDFYGNDFHYEYSVSNNPNNNNNNNNPQQKPPNNNINNNGNNNNGTKRQNQPGRHNGEISSQYFLANRVDNWTSDYNYLESLITAEDGSHPDRELVLLWCLRNNVQLYEVSAATGDGVTAAFQALVALAAEPWTPDDDKVVDGNDERMTVPKSSNDYNGTTTTTSPRPFQRNKELDLRTQYQPPKQSALLACFPTFSLFRQCLPK